MTNRLTIVWFMIGFRVTKVSCLALLSLINFLVITNVFGTLIHPALLFLAPQSGTITNFQFLQLSFSWCFQQPFKVIRLQAQDPGSSQ